MEVLENDWLEKEFKHQQKSHKHKNGMQGIVVKEQATKSLQKSSEQDREFEEPKRKIPQHRIQEQQREIQYQRKLEQCKFKKYLRHFQNQLIFQYKEEKPNSSSKRNSAGEISVISQFTNTIVN
ncbi:5918_t:CDS:2 [Diversispora eburnea]|uniref:5918_t:CDS:1 n=1 Tax=Diversispora eburnea TaxID=1213867 RepID=A0A9N8YV38_9GLOM|nr:5918_t:CDS:2 [Diversispora eburnea]